MSKNNDTYQLIEDYIDGVLSPSERLAFESELAVNATLKEELELHQLANDLVLESKIEHLSGLVNIERARSNSRKNLQKGILGLGLLAIAITTYIGLTNKNKNNTPPLINKGENELVWEEKADTTQQEEVIVTPTQVEITPKTLVATPKKITQEQLVKVDPDTFNHFNNDKKLIELDSKELKINTITSQERIKEAISNPCSSVNISFEVAPKTICENTQHGEIQLETITGGQSPYSTKIINEYNEFVTNGYLISGVYKVQLTDKNNCTSKLKTVELIETRCLEDYSISRSYNSSIDIPAFDEPIAFSVLKQNNSIYFERKFDAYEAIHWDGLNLNGEILDGYYLLTVTTHSGKTLKGTITILP